MIELVAKDNGMIELMENKFPLGLRDIIKIHIQDEVIKSRLKIQGTHQCAQKDNLYYYGLFDSENDVNNVTTFNSTVESVSGVSGNYSRCIRANLTTTEGNIKLRSSNTLKTNSEYVCSFIYKDDCIFDVNCNKGDIDFYIGSYRDGWNICYCKKFKASDEANFELTIAEFNGDLYIDNLCLFEAKNEINMPQDDFVAEINIVNPVQRDNIINVPIKWDVAEDDICVTLYFPPITVADYQDRITCVLKIYQPLVGKYTMFGDILYTEDKELIYTSEEFSLQGYILPPDTD